jgi:hypothetical protein
VLVEGVMHCEGCSPGRGCGSCWPASMRRSCAGNAMQCAQQGCRTTAVQLTACCVGALLLLLVMS